jgi:hypothetical protein
MEIIVFQVQMRLVLLPRLIFKTTATKEERVENIQGAARAAQSDQDGNEKRERSTIQFPYNNLDDAVSIAKAVHEDAGLSCTIDQLAAYVKNSLPSGAFRLRVSNASTFGLTENARGEVCLTALGRRVADSSQEAAAKIEAFLAVPLYARIYENYTHIHPMYGSSPPGG